MHAVRRNPELEPLPCFITQKPTLFCTSQTAWDSSFKKLFISILAKEEECCDRATD